ncbi:MAG TPA: metallopeptidase TldD-related protein [Thermoanaerobaculaceae bacterium]|nr:metallopeptidase TldD-related protein [Thermoanaerobaculaceae bacterium]
MEPDRATGLAELAAAITRARVRGLDDVFLERRIEAAWRLDGGRVVAREVSLSEGAAVRRDGVLVSGDGLDRPVLAGLLGIADRSLPAFSPPRFAPPPSLEETLDVLPADWSGVRWRWSWAAVLAGGTAVAVARPQLAEVTSADGQRALFSWPPDRGLRFGGSEDAARASLQGGRIRALLSPAAATVLLHELFGHPLEGDILLRRGSPWCGRFGERIVPIPLSVRDDPTRGDLPGGFSADDEGVAGAARPLLVDGVLAGALADRRTALGLGVAPGNARRASVHEPPRPRISNLVATAREPLAQPPREDASVEVVALVSGTLEPASRRVLLRVRRAFSLRRGARRQMLAPFTLAGTVDALTGGLLAAAEPAASSAEPGWCAKDGEVVATGGAAPWLLLEGLEVR